MRAGSRSGWGKAFPRGYGTATAGNEACRAPARLLRGPREEAQRRRAHVEACYAEGQEFKCSEAFESVGLWDEEGEA